MSGPLAGIRVVELGSAGPGPFGAMILADLGADVLRVDRAVGGGLVGPSSDHSTELLHRGRRSVAVDLKHPKGAEVVLRLVESADVGKAKADFLQYLVLVDIKKKIFAGLKPSVVPERKNPSRNTCWTGPCRGASCPGARHC